jgi:hypothetical protein
MSLTRFQRKLLLKYRSHRHKPLSLFGLLLPMLPPVAIAVGVVALSAYTFPRQGTLFIAGLVVGVLLRNLALVVHGLRVIPALLEVIDWEKLDRMLERPPQRS